MSLYGASVEYGLHCLLYLVDLPQEVVPSSRDLAEFQGVSPSYAAKLFTQLEKAGLVASSEGTAGGYRLARPVDEITVLDVVDALEGGKPLFQCRKIVELFLIAIAHDLPVPDALRWNGTRVRRFGTPEAHSRPFPESLRWNGTP